MTEHTLSYTNFQMFVLVHHHFIVIIWLNCYEYFLMRRVSVKYETNNQHGTYIHVENEESSRNMFFLYIKKRMYGFA